MGFFLVCILAAFIDGLYRINEKSMTGIIIGVCIALTCIVLCILILFTQNKTWYVVFFLYLMLTFIYRFTEVNVHSLCSKSSSSSKTIGPVRNEVSSANQHPAENTDVHVPMMRTHFIDAKVIEMNRNKVTTLKCLFVNLFACLFLREEQV